ncbi:type II toxin-antitoxin system TacA family antitoxin [Thiorhodovibrio frisius]|uniref:type II toxin-antitoxin system TacA family antitoxin n=1 Tax=Thiorhodovibrio frisius TaxID=631362 RepID=UPI0002F63224
MPPDVLRTLHCAADLTGATLSQFLVQAALKEAQVVIEHEKRLHLSPRDAERLLDLLEHPPLPNSALAAAQNRYETPKRDADSAFDWPA